MTEINPILKNTSAYKIAENLDKQDGTADGKISDSVWNEFVKDKGGKEVSEFIDIEDAMKSITTYAIRGAKAAKTTANELGDKWFKATPESGNADGADGADGTGGAGSVDDKKNAPVNKGNVDEDKAAAAKEQGLRPTYNPIFYYSETEKEHYIWNSKTKKFTKYSNIAYFNKDKSYVRKYKNKDGSAKVIDYSSEGYPTRMQARNWQNKNYLNKDFAAKKLGLQPTYATKSEGIYYDKGTKMHYKWNEKTHAFDALNKNTRFVTKNGEKYEKGTKCKIITFKHGTKKEVITTNDGRIFENTYDTKGNLKTKIEKIITKDVNGKISNVYHKDSNGRYVYREAYKDGVKTDSWNYRYDNGREIGGTRKYFNSNGTIKEIRDYELDANGHQTKTVHKDSSGNVDHIDYWTRNADGRATALKITDANGKTTEFREWVYDANGREIKHIRKGPDGKITDVWETKYNTDGSVKEEIHKDGKGNVIKD